MKYVGMNWTIQPISVKDGVFNKPTNVLCLLQQNISQLNDTRRKKQTSKPKLVLWTLAPEPNLLECLLLHLEQYEMVMELFFVIILVYFIHPCYDTFINTTFFPPFLLHGYYQLRIASYFFLFARIYKAFTFFPSNISATCCFYLALNKFLVCSHSKQLKAMLAPLRNERKRQCNVVAIECEFQLFEMSFKNCENNSCFIRFVCMCAYACMSTFSRSFTAMKNTSNTVMLLKYLSERKRKFELRKNKSSKRIDFFFCFRLCVAFQFFFLCFLSRLLSSSIL